MQDHGGAADPRAPADAPGAHPPTRLEPGRARPAKVGRVIDQVRDKLGPEAIVEGHAFAAPPRKSESGED